MADEGSKFDFKGTWRPIELTAMVAVALALTYMKISDIWMFLMGGILSCFTLAFAAVAAVLTLRLTSRLIKSKGKFVYEDVLIAAGAVLALVCMINSGATDLGRSDTRTVLSIDAETSVYLCEYSDTDELTGVEHTYIEVYRTGGRFLKHVGTIDETYFGMKCVAAGAYSHSSDEGSRTVTLELSISEEPLCYSFKY